MEIAVRPLPDLGEEVHGARLDSGLDVFVIPKPGFHKKYAVLATRYGSVDNCFVPPGGERTCVPDGIAHFLEHVLFQKENGNASDWFSELGALSNAYTSYLLTAYLFETTEHFEAALNLLLNFVFEPYFSVANVEKERGIIEQELMMYNDMPDHRVMVALLEALYHEHPVRIDVGGTVESIHRITPELLETCYRTFYHPDNMALVVVGDVVPQRVIEQAGENLGRRGLAPRGGVARLRPQEPQAVRERRVETTMTVSRPRLAVGFKEVPHGQAPAENLRVRILMGLILRGLFGRSSELHAELLADGLIDDSFFYYFESAADYAHTLIGGETPDPDRLLDRLQAGIARRAERGINADEFERLRKAYLGRYLENLNSLEGIASAFLSHHFRGTSLFDTVDVVRSLTVEEANDRLRRHFGSGNDAASILRPK